MTTHWHVGSSIAHPLCFNNISGTTVQRSARLRRLEGDWGPLEIRGGLEPLTTATNFALRVYAVAASVCGSVRGYPGGSWRLGGGQGRQGGQICRIARLSNNPGGQGCLILILHELLLLKDTSKPQIPAPFGLCGFVTLSNYQGGQGCLILRTPLRTPQRPDAGTLWMTGSAFKHWTLQGGTTS